MIPLPLNAALICLSTYDFVTVLPTSAFLFNSEVNSLSVTYSEGIEVRYCE
jgi:hypothetical protein